ncbi:hypothetical protein [Solilutibacter silvestris]|uniref:hypothetical protein n=1 Tax=Solilutibacter silvestris TaxID=1645665 RepID=UPI003D349D01
MQQTQQLKPGDVFRVHNTTSQAHRVTLTTPAGTVIRVMLHPGADIELVASTEPMQIDMAALDDAKGRLHAVD